MKILHFGGISELWISKFSSTMVKSFTLLHQNPTLWGHFRAGNLKNFPNQSDIIHSMKILHSGGHFRAINFTIIFNHGEISYSTPSKFITLGKFQWNWILIIFKLINAWVSIYKNWRPSCSHCPVDIFSPVRPWILMLWLEVLSIS